MGEEGKVSKERDTVERDDFWATTSNKQLNFVQHVKTRSHKMAVPPAQAAPLLTPAP